LTSTSGCGTAAAAHDEHGSASRVIRRARRTPFAVISTLDLHRTAVILIQHYGVEDALLIAVKRCDALL